MKKLLLISLLFVITGCQPQPEELKQEITDLEATIAQLEDNVHQLKNTRTKLRIEKDLAEYFLVVQIKQSHFFDLEKMAKDEMNKTSIKIPTTKEFYDSVEVGIVLNDEFRSGSFFLEGSVGRWDIKIIDKVVE